MYTDTYLYHIKSYNINTNVFHIELNVSLPVQNTHHKSILTNEDISGLAVQQYVLLFAYLVVNEILKKNIWIQVHV